MSTDNKCRCELCDKLVYPCDTGSLIVCGPCHQEFDRNRASFIRNVQKFSDNMNEVEVEDKLGDHTDNIVALTHRVDECVRREEGNNESICALREEREEIRKRLDAWIDRYIKDAQNCEDRLAALESDSRLLGNGVSPRENTITDADTVHIPHKKERDALTVMTNADAIERLRSMPWEFGNTKPHSESNWHFGDYYIELLREMRQHPPDAPAWIQDDNLFWKYIGATWPGPPDWDAKP